MGSIPTQTFKADLNGTGTLVDITTYVDDNRFVHTYGRRDWTSTVQPPGQLTVTLDNNDGRFTPGSTANYTRGVVRNMTVEWTCGSRVRRFYVSSSDLAFPTGVAGKSAVTLRCRDALALLSERKMQALVRETIMSANPVGMWPCDDSVSGSATFRDTSGDGQSALYPYTRTPGSTLSWGIGSDSSLIGSGGRGPRTDGASTVQLNVQATTPIAATSGGTVPYGALRTQLTTDGSVPAGNANRDIIMPNLATPYAGSTYPLSGWNAGSGSLMRWVLSGWFSIKDIYGAATGGSGTDGPYVYLFGVTQFPNQGFHVMWRIPDRKLVVATRSAIAVLSSSSYSVSPTDVHHFSLTVEQLDWTWNSGVYYGIASKIRGQLDGTLLAANSVAGGNCMPPSGILVGAPYGDDFANANYITTTGANRTIYALSGSVSTISLHGPDQVNYTGGSPYWPSAPDVWNAGTTGPVEDASARFNRVGALAQRGLPATLAWSPQGTCQVGLLGPHDTTGKDALTVLCETLSSEEASLDTIYTGGVDTVRAWLDSTQRTLTPALTVDAQDDAGAAPDMGFDLSGVVATAEAKGWGQSASWSDTAAAAQWQGGSTSVASAMVSAADLLLLAQYRTVRGRATRLSPTRVVVDAAGSKANVTAALLGLYPGATVRVQGLPSSKVGYSSIDCILIGVSERHGLGTNQFELTLIPRTAELYTDPLLGTEGPWRLIDAPAWAVSAFTGFILSAGFQGTFMGIYGSNTGSSLSSSATTAYIIGNAKTPAAVGGVQNTIPETFFSQDAADYPLYVQVDSEVIYMPNPPAAPVSATVLGHTCWSQQVTGLVRGQQGTTAVAHNAFSNSVAGDQGLAVVTDIANIPLLAF